MKNPTVILIAVLLLLGGVVYMVLQKPGERSVSAAEGTTLAELDSAAVDKIEIRTPAAAVTLEKRGAEWFLAQPINYKADQTPVTDLVHQLITTKTRNVVSTKPEKHGMFQVDSSGTFVRVFDHGSVKLAFILGKGGTSWTESYLRISGSDEVLLVEGLSSYSVNKPVRDWRDKTIASVLRDQIKDVRYQYGDTVFVLSNPDSVWRIGGQPANEGLVQSLLGALSSVQADDFIDTTLTPAPKFSASIQYGNVQLQFAYNKPANKFFVLSSNSPQAFAMESWRANQLLKRKSELLQP